METTSPEIIRCASMPACSSAIADALEKGVLAAIDRQGYCTLVLSGGKTPAPLLQVLGGPPFSTRIPWAKVLFFFGDERFVPPDHPESNYGMAHKTLLSHLAIAKEQVFRMPVEISPHSAAARHYQRTMMETFGNLTGKPLPYGEGEYPAFDLILLGMGADGHTASLFPGHPVLSRTDWVAEVEAEGARPPVPRLTLTLPVINNADTVLFLVGGTEKIELAESFLARAPQACYPASLVRPRCRLLWYFVN